MAFAVPGAERRIEHLHRSPSGPISLVPSPFDFPQYPKRCWRIVGQWKRGGEFLVLIGDDETDLFDRLHEALAPLTRADLNAVEALWLERWRPGSRFEYPYWEPVQEVPLRPIRFSRSMRLKRLQPDVIPLPLPPKRVKGVAS
jgi:hypothetical protein